MLAFKSTESLGNCSMRYSTSCIHAVVPLCQSRSNLIGMVVISGVNRTAPPEAVPALKATASFLSWRLSDPDG